MSIYKYAKVVKDNERKVTIHVIAYSNKIRYNVPCCGSARVLQVIKLYTSLTLTLLMWTKWWAPASASKWQMGFNSAFKGLNM
jgi:hypothetical protein